MGVLFYLLGKWKTEQLKIKMEESVLNPSSLVTSVEIKGKCDYERTGKDLGS